MPPVQTQQQWYGLTTTDPGHSGDGVLIGNALAELADANPQPYSVQGLLEAHDICWWSSYPCPNGNLSNGTSVTPFSIASDNRGRARIGCALTTKRNYLASNPAPLPPPQLGIIANELENDPPALVVPGPKGGGAVIPDVSTFTIQDSPELQRLRGTIADRKSPAKKGARKARRKTR